MLILSRKLEQSLLIQGNIEIKVLGVDGDRVKLGINAPAGIKVVRAELVEAVRSENAAALAADGPATVTALSQVLAGAGRLAGPT